MINENLEIEYKLAKNKLPEDVWETYSAFANTVGGTIYLGIKEVDGRFIVEGVENSQSIIDDFWNTITSKQKVNKNILTNENVCLKKMEEKEVIIITVPEAEYGLKPISVKTKKRWISYKRLGSGDREATEEQIQYMHANSQSDLDSFIIEGYDLDDLNIEDIRMYRDDVYKNSGEERIKNLSIEDFLKDYSKEDIRITSSIGEQNKIGELLCIFDGLVKNKVKKLTY
ncbi:hypothetical protein C7J88_07450 [Staphylococcus muscae]|uniref:Putative transcriptional regulator n=1 Tax=Staphylococcus muscae TaxID=1294 RepID=A0A240BRM2_9STAP|nr:RNA-binding domain-containing protein [Staphylococcus muscae]AVQ34021.1 hypothetical protein C7J88_07450 [Staphylococcus muscae]PNZ01648.1 hypothetical protein CD131_08960 [Staphylococcus muscae]GGA82405.1 hypothetical protein GCM10007183_03270 [Staphylococcus muscae]SNV98364.1 putative transcriptional regulator [Staphylococcus muscae]